MTHNTFSSTNHTPPHTLSSPGHNLSESPTMAAPSSTLPPARTAPSRRLSPKHNLWLFMGLAALFVFITTDLFIAFDYPLYHPYRMHLLHDRALLIPHAIAGTVAFIAGPLQFSSRLRARHLKLHRILGRVYVFSVLSAATFAFFMELAAAVTSPASSSKSLSGSSALSPLSSPRATARSPSTASG